MCGSHTNPARWHTVIEGNFKFKEAIHMKEGRATHMGLWCSCSVYRCRRVVGPSALGNLASSFGPWFWSCAAYAELCPATCASTCFWSSGCSGSCQPLSRQIPRKPLRFGLAMLALSLNSVMAILGSRLLFGDKTPMSHLAAT